MLEALVHRMSHISKKKIRKKNKILSCSALVLLDLRGQTRLNSADFVELNTKIRPNLGNGFTLAEITLNLTRLYSEYNLNIMLTKAGKFS